MPKKVLICDDEPYILESVSLVVRQEGYTVITAEDGETGLRLAQEELPDLVLLDVMMSKKDGFEVCRELKSDPCTQGMYVLMLTAMGQERDVERGRESGADEYMTKPFSPRNLRKRLHQLLD
jgi:two-component system, OmpR family, alkaline phosphatase synthesis response regulator PhoP